MREGASPILTVTLSIGNETDVVDLDAYIDSGTSTSLFAGSFFAALGGELINERQKTFTSTAGVPITAYLHPVSITVPELGSFNLDIAFSNGPIFRNLLGRDFFNLVQIGFRESRQQIYLNATP